MKALILAFFCLVHVFAYCQSTDTLATNLKTPPVSLDTVVKHLNLIKHDVYYAGLQIRAGATRVQIGIAVSIMGATLGTVLALKLPNKLVGPIVGGVIGAIGFGVTISGIEGIGEGGSKLKQAWHHGF